MKWIKVSEKLPPDDKIKAGRLENRYCTFRVSNEGIFIVDGHGCATLDILEEWFPGIEWLNESESSLEDQDALWDDVRSIINEDLYQELVTGKSLKDVANKYTLTRK